MHEKTHLRRKLRAARRDHVARLNPAVAALTFHRPPGAVLDLVPAGATVGLYLAGGAEAPTLGYARFLHEAGHAIALPWFATRDTPMAFRRWASPWLEELLEPGPYGTLQPRADEAEADVVPDVLFVPLVGFTAEGHRLGQGGGHYDRWLADHPGTVAIGLGWDCQRAERLPLEPHDRRLDAVVTPTRIHGPFERVA